MRSHPVMAHQLSYQSTNDQISLMRRLSRWLLVSRCGRAALVLMLYTAMYCGCRATKFLVHRNYLYCDYTPDANGFVHPDIVIEDVGHGSFYDSHGGPARGTIDRLCRLVFYPFAEGEGFYWRRYSR